MPLDLPPEAVAVLTDARLHERLLLQFDLTGGASPATYRFTDDDATIVWSGHDWIGMGQIASVGARGFSLGASASGLRITVNGAGLATPDDPSGATLLATVVEEARPRDAVTITRLHFNPATGVPLFESDYFSGYIARLPLDRSTVGQGAVATLTVEIESDELLLRRAGRRRRSDADQRRMWPTGGGGLHLVVTTAASGGSVFWGQDAPNQGVASGPAFIPGNGPGSNAANKLLRML